ncbi:ArnT family glycosyltransferase [Elioraea rosea]|uniref:ArnT family glycosyltransferase n=1 Tax=Elioraea rosea TaxID=2492390 RepID=UPI0011827AEA|nr:glycosyltransferase family 39 protein [Elioraea rosea]
MAAPHLLDRILGTRHPTLLVLAICLAAFLPGFFSLPPSDRDEARFAQATKQMLETGDFVAIRFGDVARNKKPVGIHWAQAASVSVAEGLGLATRTSIWPYRIPSLLGAMLAALATLWFGRGIFGPRAALLAALALPVSVVVVVEAHIAKTDAALLGVIAVMMGLFAQAYLRPAAFGAPCAAGFWAALGAGALLKGPVAPMVAGLAALVLYVLDRRAKRPRDWLAALRPAWGLPLALLIVLPWAVLIWIATDGAFFADAIGGDLGGKVAGADEAHGGPPGYHLLLVSLTLFPLGLVVLRAIPGTWAARTEPAVRFLLAWIIPTWIVFELLPTKLPHYVSVTFPAVLMLTSAWLLDPARREPPRWLARVSAVLWFAALAILAALALAVPIAARSFTWGSPLVLAAAGLLAWVGWGALRRKDLATLAAAGLILSPVVTGALLQGVLPRAEALWIAPRVVAALDAHWAATGGRPPADERPFATAGFHEPSLVFLAGTDTRLVANGQEAAQHLAERPRGVALVRERYQAAFMAEAARLGIGVRAVGTVAGLNYSRGQRLTLVLYARD